MSETLFDTVPDEVRGRLVDFTNGVTKLEDLVKNVLKLNITKDYTTSGIDTKEHPIKKEIDRMLSLLKRCQFIYSKQVPRKTHVNVEASGRVLKHALWQSAIKGKKKSKK